MEKNIVRYHIHDEKVEAIKSLLAKELFDYTKTEGYSRGQKKEQLTPAEFKVLVVEELRAKTQIVIENIRQILGVATLIHNVKADEVIVEKRVDDIRKELNHAAHEKNELVREKAVLPTTNSWKERYSLLLLPVAIFFSAIDFSLSLQNFSVVYPWSQALLMALGVGGAVFAAHLFSKWAQRAMEKAERRKRIVIVLVTAFMFFLVFAVLRSQAAGGAVRVSLDNEDVALAMNAYANAVVFLFLSFVLFASCFWLSLLFSKTPEEVACSKKHRELDEQIGVIDKQQQALRDEAKRLPIEIERQKADIRHLFFYQQRCIEECKATARAAVAEYKKVYAQQHGTVPDFFTVDCELVFIDESFVTKSPEA